MYYPESLKKVADQAIRLYLAKTDDRLFYHNLAHTVRLLDAVDKINTHYKLDDKNYFIVCASGWLYDLEIIDSGSGEIKSAELTEGVLKSLEINKDEIEGIKNCISATKIPQQPITLNEKIICDALSFYIGSVHFPEYSKLMRRETEAFTNEKIKGSSWRFRTISLLEKHQFHTEFCQALLNKNKEENLQVLIRQQEEKHWQKHLNSESHKQKKTIHELFDNQHAQPAEGNPANTQITQPDNFTRKTIHPLGWKYKSKHHLSGVETVFRNSSANHLNLSVMADNKAFIMISVNSILISLGIGLIIGKFVLIPKLFVPTVLLLLVNVFTIIYSVLATRPGNMKGKFTREDVNNKKVDLLFFGNFFKTPLVDFEYGMKQMMDDSDFLYDNLIRDIYAQGQILGRKFRLLRFSYNIFMYGTVSTVIAYIISFFL
jgi:hypothetical protein